MKLIDLGCLNGDSSLHFVTYPNVTEIEAYDPNPDFKELWNAITKFYPQIKFHQKAVSNYTGSIKYTKRPRHAPLGSTTNSDKKDWGMGMVISVDCVDISELITDEVWMKLDVEGEEFNILERLIETDKLKYVERLYIEWHTGKLRGNYEPRFNNIKSELEKANVEVLDW